ncbi:MAG: TolC family protein [Muribaculaceae bacterium]|nr:TolC family protein [Muribaculaceae bacterium]
MKGIILITAAFMAPLTASAQDAGIFANPSIGDVTESDSKKMPDKWTFDDCVNWAVENSTDVRKILLSALQADEEIGAAKDAWLPNVGFATSHSFTNYPSPDEGRSANVYGSSYGINAAWTVWEGNIRKYRLESAKIARQQQNLAGDDVVKNIKLGILQAYLNTMYAKEAVEIARQTLEVSTSQTERARRLMESGRTSKVEFAQIESQMAQDQYNLVQAEGNLASTKMTLKTILELGIDYDMQLADLSFSDSDINAILPSMTETYAAAAAWLPGIKSNDLSKEIYDNDIKIAKAGNLPTISLQGGLGSGYTSGGKSWASQMGHGFNENIGLSLSVPIYDGNATRRSVAKAKLAALEYDINKENLLNDLSQTIESLYIEAENSKARYTSGLKQLEATQLTAQLVDRQFELGYVAPLDLLTAHNNLVNAKLELLQSKFMAILANKTIGYYATTEMNLP